MRERKCKHQGTQHLGLTGTGCTDQQAVRAHTLLGGFLNIQNNRNTLGGDSKGNAQTIASVPPLPLPFRIEVTNIADIEQFHEVLRTLRIGLTDGGCRIPTTGGQEASEATGHGLGLGNSHVVGVGEHWLCLKKQNFHGGVLIVRGMQKQTNTGRVHEHAPRGQNLHDRHACAALDRAQVRIGRKLGTVGNHDQMRPRACVISRLEVASGRHFLTQEILELGVAGAHHSRTTQSVGHLSGTNMRQPLHPLPVREVFGSRQYRDLQGRIWRHNRKVADHRADFSASALAITGDLDMRELAQVQAERKVFNGLVDI